MSKAEDDRRSDVEWKEPAPRPTQYNWEAIAAQLREKPGEWALVFERDRTTVVNAIRQGNVAAVRPADGFEVRTRNNTIHPRQCSLFMRWNPTKEK